MYQKRISYVYEYVNGEKGKNIGFVKMAEFQEGYKMHIQLRLPQFGTRSLILYGYKKHNEEFLLIRAGEIALVHGMGELFLQEDGIDARIAQVPQMDGFVCFTRDSLEKKIWTYFCGQSWNGEVIRAEQFVFAKNTSEAEVEVVEEKLREERKMWKEEERIDKRLDLDGALENKTKEKQLYQLGEEAVSLQEMELGEERADNSEFYLPCQSKEQELEKQKRLQEISLEQEEDWESGEASAEEGGLTRENEVGKRELEWSTQQEKIAKKDGENTTTSNAWNVFEERKMGLERQWEKIKEESSTAMNTWGMGEEILKKFPVMNPFFDESILEAVRMEPKDLGNFPMEFWYLANNSFLLHGYYCYRHILFVKQKKRGELRYMLGVPGNQTEKESFMANLFGFTQFMKIRTMQAESYGYWWVRLV